MVKYSGKRMVGWRNYKIKDEQKKVAGKLGVIIKPSSNKLKKIDVFNKNGRFLASIGGRYYDGVWYGDYASYLKHPEDRYGNEVSAKERRRLYLNRHAHEPKFKIIKGKRLRTPSYWADEILW